MDFSAVALDEKEEAAWHEFVELLDETVGSVEEWPVHTRHPLPDDLQKRLGSHGFLAPRWPVAEGGRDAGAVVDRIVSDELIRRQIAMGRMNAMVSEAVRKYGSDEIRDDVISGVAGGTVKLCLGYSEPDGGSDIAAARTRAVRDGDHWIINGAKVFTSTADTAQYVFLLTRTDPELPKHKGLTMFLVPLDSPGIEIQPLITFSEDRTNITYYSDVRVHDKYRLGGVNEGWRVLSDPLNIEHGTGESDTGRLADVHVQGLAATTPWAVLLGRALRWATRPGPDGTRPFDDPVVADGVAEAAVYYEIARNTPGAMGKVAAADSFLAAATRLLELAGPEGIVMSEDERIEDGVFDWAYRRAPIPTITGGTVEVFKNLIATSELGLPRQQPTK